MTEKIDSLSPVPRASRERSTNPRCFSRFLDIRMGVVGTSLLALGACSEEEAKKDVQEKALEALMVGVPTTIACRFDATTSQDNLEAQALAQAKEIVAAFQKADRSATNYGREVPPFGGGGKQKICANETKDPTAETLRDLLKVIKKRPELISDEDWTKLKKMQENTQLQHFLKSMEREYISMI